MKHPRDYRDTEKGQKVMYSHGSRCPVPIEMGLLTTPWIFLFTLKGPKKLFVNHGTTVIYIASAIELAITTNISIHPRAG